MILKRTELETNTGRVVRWSVDDFGRRLRVGITASRDGVRAEATWADLSHEELIEIQVQMSEANHIADQIKSGRYPQPRPAVT